MREKEDFNEAVEFCKKSDYCSIEPWGTSIAHLRLTIIGKKGTPYADGKFLFEIKLPKNYPNIPPFVRCVTKIWHPNIDSSFPPDLPNISDFPLLSAMVGQYGYWMPPNYSPSVIPSNLKDVIKDVKCFIHLEEPLFDPRSALNSKAGEQYLNNRKRFEKNARYFTRKYAIQPFLKIEPFESRIELIETIEDVKEVKLFKYRDDEKREWYLKGDIKEELDTLGGRKIKITKIRRDDQIAFLTFDSDIKEFLLSFKTETDDIEDFNNWNEFVSLLKREKLYVNEDCVDWDNLKEYIHSQDKIFEFKFKKEITVEILSSRDLLNHQKLYCNYIKFKAQ